MLISEIMDTDVAECAEDTQLEDVYELIQSSYKSYVVVIDSSQHRVPIGIVNEHSICENLIKRSRNTKGLYAGSVMSSRIKRVAEDTEVEKCRDLIATDADAIVVVNEWRQFKGVLEPAQILENIEHQEAARARGSFFSGVLGHAIPAKAEIPVFGWLK
jgi:predicted transcriptional regulator